MQESMDIALINGKIITMDKEKKFNTALAIKKGKFITVGENSIIEKMCTKETKIIDLEGKTVIPGLFDAHGHFFINSIYKNYWHDVSCYPMGKITCINDLIENLKKACVKLEKDKPLVAFGFDDTLIKEYRMPEAIDLDVVSKTRPIIVLHRSLHMLSANTKAMEIVGIINNNFNPEGGTVYYKDGKPIGIFEEASAIEPFNKYIYPNEIYEHDKFYEDMSKEYLSKGVTTVCEGMASEVTAKSLLKATQDKTIKNRVIVCRVIEEGIIPSKEKNCNKHYIDGPVKLFMDGSIQAYTAFLSKPFYKKHPTRTKDENYKGFPSMEIDKLTNILKDIEEKGREFAIHCNGDAALDYVLEAYEKTNAISLKSRRNLIIHCQTSREDQLDKMKKYKLLPSFFPAHIYVWGDRHFDTFLGPDRANRMNPINSALKRKMIFSMHNDSPVTPIDPLKLVWNAVTRKTAEGKVLGEEQKISIYEALKGITINAAYQYHMENFTGSITEGKCADFVILDKNPLECEENELPNIKILSTWIDGNEVYHN